MKNTKFLNYKIVFRCDAADIPEIGSGHVYRCLIIANNLKKKFSLKTNQIVFVIKAKGKYSKNLEILKNHNFKTIEIQSKIKDYSIDEVKELKKLKANLIVIDRLGKVTKTFMRKLKII